MPLLFPSLRQPRSLLADLLLALAACAWLVDSPGVAAPPAPRSVVLKEEDWRQAPLKPVAPSEIDALVARELKRSGIEPLGLTTDEAFIRRVSLDLTGQLPRPAEIAAFVRDTDPEKRARLIDRLLESDAYARHWAQYWRDVVSARITNRRSMGLTRSFEEWLYGQLRENRSWKEIAVAIVTAEGKLKFSLNTPSAENGALFFLVAHDNDEAEERAAETSRVFLGIQIQCAQCHDHPSEPWTRQEFHQLAAYFARIKYEQLFEDKKLVGVQLITLPDREHRMKSALDPDKASLIHPRFLDGQAPDKNLRDRDRRQALADVLVDEKNHWFAAAYVNRVWSELMGQSFYQHVDDLGPNKPVIFPEVLTRLTGAFRGTNYDPKALFRAIMNSETYQRQNRPSQSSDVGVPFAAANLTQLRADALWDALVTTLGTIQVGARFHTGGGVRFNSTFLEGKFKATFDFDPSLDAREVKGTIPQALLLMNNPLLNERIRATKSNLLGRILKDHADDAEAISQVYLHALARRPKESELARCRAYVERIQNRAEAYEDILWALINSTEFQTKQ